MKKIVIVAAVIAAAISGTANAAPIISANFETGFGPFTAAGNVSRANGTTYAQCCGTSPSYTNNFVAFGGGNQPSGSISSTFSTVLGRVYTVAFRYGGVGGGNDPLTFTVGGGNQTYNALGNNDLSSTFQSTSFSFVATGSQQTLTITSNGVNNVDALVDDVSVSAVPEPATWGMMVLGFGAIGFGLRSRKRSVRVTYA